MGYPTLYGKAKTGKIKQWTVTVEGSTITVLYGQVGGTLTPQITPITEGKNIGRANETTPEQQAQSEAQSKWNKQIDQDYRESIDDIPESTLPPLAKKFQESSAALGSEYDVLCKFNGVRCTIFYNDGRPTFQSRGGKPYPVIQDIADELYDLVWQYDPKQVLDGELYCHGMYLEDITSCVKKHKKDTSRINFHVFDTYIPSMPDMVWQDRIMNVHASIGVGKRVEAVATTRCTSEKFMIGLHDMFVEKGYEGVVCRKLGSKFVFGHRTSDFQKYKVPLDREFRVIRIDIDKNGCAVPWCYIENKQYPKRTEFKAPLVGSHERQQYIADHQDEFIDKHLNVVFESYTKYGVPGKPKGHYFREVDEDEDPVE